MKQNFKWLLALVAMVASINLGWAAETVSWTAASGALGSTISSKGSSTNGTIKTGDFEWNYTRTLKNLKSGKSDYIAMSSGYMQIGSSNAGEDVNFATSAFSGKTISSITIDCGSASHSLSVKVGGVACTISSALSSTKQEVVATPTSTSNTGNIDISFSVGTANAALYVKSIKVVYNNDDTPKTPTTITLSEVGTESQVSGDYYVDDKYQLPSSEATCGTKEFVGWSTVKIESATDTKPTENFYEAGEEVTLGETNIFYAVVADKSAKTASDTKITRYTNIESGTSYNIGATVSSTDYYLKSNNTSGAGKRGSTTTRSEAGSFTFIGSGTTWNIKVDGTEYYMALNSTNASVTYQDDAADYTASNKGDNRIDLTNASKYLRLNPSSTTSFGSYASTIGDGLWLQAAGGTTYTGYTTKCAPAGKTSISYNKNTEDEVTGNIPASVEQDNGVAYTVSTATLTRSGYTFKGWNTDKDATEGISTIPAASITGSAITLYAIWQAKTIQSVVVSGTPTKTNYEAGETFDPAGLTVTINYSDEQVVVTEGIDWTNTPSGALEFGTTSVSVTATVGGKTSVAYPVAITVAKAPSIVTWDLSIVDDELKTASENQLQWTNAVVTMTVDKADASTNANNYYPGTSGKSYTSTRFYASSVLTIAPVDNNTITKVEFTATQESYATALQGSTWTNASASVSNTTLVTVTPTDGTQAFSATIGGTCGFTAVKVYYQPGAELASIAVKTAPSKVVYNAGESFDPTGLIITATYSDASTKDITYDANDTKWEFAPGLTDKLDATDKDVIISYNEIMCEDALEITVNRIASNLAAVSATKILTVDDMLDITEWYTIAANYDGTVAFSSDNTDVFDVEEGTGLAYAAGSATLTITAPQTNTYAEASVTIEVTVNAAAVPCSVTWMNNGDEYTAGDPSTVVNAGQKVTKLPTVPTPCDAQHVFKGWTNAAIATPQADAPGILFTDAASAPTVDADNTVYYAVYAIESQDEDIDSYTFTEFASAQTVDFETTGGNTIKMAKGSGGSNPAWSSDQARLYATGFMTVSSTETISKIVYTYTINANNKGVSPTIEGVSGKTNAGTWNEGTKTWTGSDTEVTFSTSGSAGNVGFTNVTIYGEPIITYSDYSTSCAAVELDKIELSGTYPTTFLQGDEFSHEGMTITASYTNSTTTKNVTNLATFTDKATGEAVDMNTTGTKTIVVSYTEDEITKTAEYGITISQIPTKTIAEFIAAEGGKCYLVGTISNDKKNKYGNFDFTDASGSIYVYGCLNAAGEAQQFLTLGVSDGDAIKVIADEYGLFGEIKEAVDVKFVEKLAFSEIAISGTMTTTEYVHGNTLSSAGLEVKGKYAHENGDPSHKITEGITWNLPEAVLGTSNYNITATVGELTTPDFPVTVTVKEPKVLKGITISNESTQKTDFFVGEDFTTTGLKVIASFDGGYDDDEVTSSCTFSRTVGSQFTDAVENETITVSYKEGDITKTATYTINATWMTLADLVAKGQPSTTAVKVWVKVTDAVIKVKNASYITTDVTYGDNQTKEVKFYKSNSVPSNWEEGGKITGNLTDVDWKFYNPDWELCPTDWDWVTTYVAPEHTPVTGVSLNTEALSITQGKNGQLTATIEPADAYDKAVEWSIINDNANGKITVSDEGLVSVAVDAVVGKTATVQVKTNDGDFTATCAVTVEELPIWATTYTSNVEMSADVSQKVTWEEVSYDCVKTNKGASATIKVPANTTELHFHIAAWNGEGQTVTIKKGETTLTTIGVTADAGVSGNSPYTLQNDPVTDYFSVALSDITEETTITIAGAAGKRFVLFGVNAIQPAAITIDPTSKDFGEVKQGFNAEQVFTLTSNAFATGTITAEIDGDDVFTASDVENNQVTVTFAPTEITDYSATLIIKHDGEQMCTAALSGKGIAATTPEIVVSAEEIDFGKVKQDASVENQQVTVTLNYLDAATASISEGAFSIDKTELVAGENTITISATAATSGTKNATITITGTGATTKTIAVKMDVTSKWAGEYTSNVEVGNDIVKISEEEYEAVKAGSGNSAGSTTITVPKGAYALHFHAAGWNTEDVTLAVKNGDTELGSFSLYKDAGVKGSGPSYTLEGENYDTDQYFYVEFDALEEETTFTFAATSGNRFVLYGVNQEGGVLPVLDHITIEGEATKLAYNTTDAFDPVGLTVKAVYTLNNVEQSPVDVTEDVDWTFDPATFNTVGEGLSVTATASFTDGDVTKTKDIVVNGISVEEATPSISASKVNIEFGEVKQGATVEDIQSKITLKYIAEASVTLSDATAFAIDKETMTETGYLTISAVTSAAVGEHTATITIKDLASETSKVLNLSITINETPRPTIYSLVTDASTLKAGDVIVMAATYSNSTYVNGDLSGDLLTCVEATIANGKLTAIGACEFTLGGEAGAWTLTSTAGKLGATAVKKLTYDNTKTNFVNTWTISISDNVATIAPNAEDYGRFLYNVSSPRFLTYTSNTSATMLLPQIYRLGIAEEVSASTLAQNADVVINEGGSLVVDAPKTLGDIVVAVGGTVTLEATTTLTVNNFVIKSTMAGGESGQVLGVTATNFEIKGEAYYDLVLGDDGNPDKWHAFAVPFNVDAINGVYDLDDNKLTNEVNYAIMDYHGDVRAEGKYGWKKFSGIMQPGVFYLMTVDGQRTTYRMKMNGGFHASGSSITVNEYASGTDTDAGWNGIANNQLNYVSVDAPVQVLNPSSYTFKTMTASTYNFTVGTPFFYQANGEEEDGKITLAAANSDKPAYAPRMTAEAKNIAVTLGNDNYTDHLYISATDEATNAYQIGRDLAKMTMTSAPAVPQIFAEAYGTKLSMIDVPMVNDQAIYALNLYAPANGEYTMGAAQVEGYEVFLTQYGNVIWNLSMSEAMIELTKGNNTEYGLILKATGAHAPTDINTLNGQESVQKFFFNSNIYIRHNNKTYGVTGQLVK